MLLKSFLIVLCPHKDEVVFHCINDILMEFLSRNVILCYINLRNLIFFLLKGIKGGVFRHPSYNGQSHRIQ